MAKKKIIVVDDFNEIRELVAFILEASFSCETVQFSSGNKAIAELKKNSFYDLIISDWNMPDGNGIEILKFLKDQKIQIPMAFLTGEEIDQNETLSGQVNVEVKFIPKPFSNTQIISTVESLLAVPSPTTLQSAPHTDATTQSQVEYIPVRLQLLGYIKEITTPLYIKINNEKYIRLTQDESSFTEETLKKYQAKNVTSLYIQSQAAEEFITEYKKRTLATKIWNEIDEMPASQFIKLNTELLRDLSNKLGWSESLIGLAADNLTKALQIVSTHPKLSHVLRQFQKIEHFGFAEHSSLLVMLTCGLAFQLEIADEPTLRKLTFASLLHDMQLTDDEFENQNKIVKSIHSGNYFESRDLKSVLAHPAKAAELCRHWDFCPGVVDTIIFQHHETPDGQGFPTGKKSSELHSLSCLFIVAEDFANYFAESFGNIDMAYFLKSRADIYADREFNVILKALGESFKAQIQTAS